MGQLGFDFDERIAEVLPQREALATPASMAPTAVAPERHTITDDFVLRVARNCDRLLHLKTLDATQMAALTAAIGTFSAARQSAYRAAMRGAAPDAFGWIGRSPELHHALSVLHAHGIDSCEIPLPVPL